jgi:hypothetical protein
LPSGLGRAKNVSVSAIVRFPWCGGTQMAARDSMTEPRDGLTVIALHEVDRARAGVAGCRALAARSPAGAHAARRARSG